MAAVATRALAKLDLEAEARRIASARPVVGLALGVIAGGRLDEFHGLGYADVASRRPVMPNTVFRIGSLTKSFTAVAVLQLCEERRLDLDAPVNAYLRAYKLVPAKSRFRPPTLRHLLTHTAGIREVLPLRGLLNLRGLDTVETGRPVPSLAQLYRGGLPVDAEPGTRFTYSNHGFGTLGQVVEDVTGMSIGHYFRERIFEPLGLASTALVPSTAMRSRLASGYTIGRHGAEVVHDFEVVTKAAGGTYSTPEDMARYYAALLDGGGNEQGSILKPASAALLFEPHYRPDPRLSGIGLGFFRAPLGGHMAVEHDGIVPGFDSQVYLAPRDGVGVIAFSNGAAGDFHWLTPEAAAMLRTLLGMPQEAVRAAVPQRPEIWSELCGWYSYAAHWSDPGKLALNGVEVFVRGGRLMIRGIGPIPALYRGLPLHADDEGDPYVFRAVFPWFGAGAARVVFSGDPGRSAKAIHFDFGPLTFERRPEIMNPRRWAIGLGAVATAAVAFRSRVHRGAARRAARPRPLPREGG